MRTAFAKGRSALTRAERRLLYHASKSAPVPQAGKPHGLPGRLIVSLTSHPPRFKTLHATLRCLLTQTVQADACVLWIAENDYKHLPPSALALQASGLTIRAHADLRSYLKLVPALAAFPDAFIVTADDDHYYDPEWLETLVKSYRPGRREVVCWRAHRICLDDNGAPLPWLTWEYEIRAGDASRLIFPTTGHGVLYPPRAFDPRVSDAATFSEMSPTHDDAWFYWMALLNGATFRKVGPRFERITWPSSQRVSLASINGREEDGVKNIDRQIGRLWSAFGWGDTPDVTAPLARRTCDAGPLLEKA
jgi:hypothetical protein